MSGTARWNGSAEPRCGRTDLQGHVVGAGGQQAAGGIPLDGVDLILERGRRRLDEQQNLSSLKKSLAGL